MTSNQSLRNYAVLFIYLWRWLRRQTTVCALTFLYARAFSLLSSLSIRFYEIQINLINIIFVCVWIVKKFIRVFEHDENGATLESFLAKIVWRNDQDLIKLRLTRDIQSKSCSAAMRFRFFVQLATFLSLFVDAVPSTPTVVLIQSMWARTACSVVVHSAHPSQCHTVILRCKWIRSQKRFEWYIGICNFLFQLSAHKFDACMCAAFSACSLAHTESGNGWSGSHNSTCVWYVCVCPVSSNTWRHRHQIRIIYEFIFCIPFLSALSFLFFAAVHSTWSVSRCTFSLSLFFDE